jgi:O-methyltransferase involved in polyketide biosynthesis
MSAGSDSRTPNVARIYDFLLGGKENFPEDREVAERLLESIPDAAVAAWDNREFLGRAVRHLVEAEGIRQFIDIGAGLPTRGNVHSAAQLIDYRTRVVYVDRDPEVVSHAGRLLDDIPNVRVIAGDLREPEGILADSSQCSLISFREPAAVVLAGVLHFICDADDPYGIVNRLMAAMCPGSFLVLSHVSGDFLPPGALKEAGKLYDRTTAPGVARSHGEVLRFFGGLDLMPPGLVNAAEWRAGVLPADPGRTIFYAGVGVKRQWPRFLMVPGGGRPVRISGAGARR